MTRVEKIQRAIDVINKRDELRGFAYFTGRNHTADEIWQALSTNTDPPREIDPSKPCCAIGALFLGDQEFDPYLDTLFENNTMYLWQFAALDEGELLEARSKLTDLYGLTYGELERLQGVNDEGRDEGRRERVLDYLYSVLEKELKENA